MKEEPESLNSFLGETRCHICTAGRVEMVPGYDAFYRVTSDCKPWPNGGRLGVCLLCGCVQKAIDEAWLSEIEKIYGNYSIYYQSNGVEQAVFESGSGQASLRSARLLESLSSHIELPKEGRLLDVGCGNGALLRAFSKFAPRWTLAGAELNDRNRKVVESIDGVEALYICAPDQIPGDFDLVTMIHLLEHLPGPMEYLSKLQDKLKPGGLLVVEIPNYMQNPFDLLVADHSSHFTAETAAELIRSAGYQLVSVATDWIPKELTVVARKVEQQSKTPARNEIDPFDAAIKSVEWLKETVNTASRCASKGNFGIFGTSIAATWLYGELGDLVSFFVDEDPHRAGKTFMGRPVYHPSEIPADTQVFVALPPPLAEKVVRRIAKSGVTFYLSPRLKIKK